MQIISFAHYDTLTLPTFAKLNIIMFSHLISLWNCLFIYEHISKPSSFLSRVFILAFDKHKQNARFASHGPLTKSTSNTSKYGTNAFVASTIAS